LENIKQRLRAWVPLAFVEALLQSGSRVVSKWG